jgi:hypothetical protein
MFSAVAAVIALLHAQPAYDTCSARCELGMRWERGVFKFDKAIEVKVDADGTNHPPLGPHSSTIALIRSQ